MAIASAFEPPLGWAGVMRRTHSPTTAIENAVEFREWRDLPILMAMSTPGPGMPLSLEQKIGKEIP